MWKTRIAVTALVLCHALTDAAIAGPDEAPPSSAGRPGLTVGVSPGRGPEIGFDRDLFAEVGRDLGREVVWVEVPRDSALRDLAAGRFSVAAGPFSAVDAMGGRLLPPVLASGDILLKRRGDGTLLGPADVAGKTVGLLGSAVDRPRLRAAAARLHGREPPRQSLTDAAADVAAGRLAAAAGPLDAVAATIQERPNLFEAVGPPFGQTARLGPVMRADPDAAVEAEAVAAALTRLRLDGRLAALQVRWFGLAFDPPEPAHQPGPARP